MSRGRPKLSRTLHAEAFHLVDGCPRTVRRAGLAFLGFEIAAKYHKFSNTPVWPDKFFGNYGKYNFGFFQKLGNLREKLGDDIAFLVYEQAIKVVRNYRAREEKFTTQDIWDPAAYWILDEIGYLDRKDNNEQSK